MINYFRKYYTPILLTFVLFLNACQTEQPTQQGDNTSPLFQLIPPNQSGIDFANMLHENDDMNYLRWAPFYMGAGVGIGDLNNDGLPEVYFAGNVQGDALYLNKGNLKFENITRNAQIRNFGKWSAGVTMADVNNDGYLDIYVCKYGPSLDPEDRRNVLYINNGDLTFTESAKAYGIDDGGFSTQATFFDMDKDGDLDLYLLNQPPDTRLISRFKLDPEVVLTANTDKLFRNDGQGKFTDISDAAGINNSGFGLNVVATDIDQDGWTDLYISVDYDQPDYLFMNNRNGTFTNKLPNTINHISNFGMGSDVADYNNDGLLDIAVVDMASEDHFRSKTNMGSMRPNVFWKNVADGKHYQYMFNTLQINNGNGTFSEVGQVAGMSKTDWSWSILIADFDNDGLKDISITNGIKRDVRNNDFNYHIKERNKQGQKDFLVQDILNIMPVNPLSNYIFQNNGDYSFTNKAKDWGFDQPGFSNGMAYGDLDNDGDLDLVISNVDAPASLYNNTDGNQNNYIRFKLETEKNKLALNAILKIEHQGTIQIQELTHTRGYFSASEPILHFGLGQINKVDKVTVKWTNGTWTVLKDIKINQLHTLSQKDATHDTQPNSQKPVSILADVTAKKTIDYTHQENDYNDFEKEILLPHKQSENGPYLAHGDVNGDGLEDFFVGGAVGYSGVLFLQKEDNTFKKSANQVWQQDKSCEDLGSLFFDADGDQDLDLYVVSGGNEYQNGSPQLQDRLYTNDGKGNFTKATNALPAIKESGQCVLAADIDGDGDQDLFVGGRLIPGQYPQAANSYIFLNENGTFTNATETVAAGLTGLGLVTDATFEDYDGDKDLDLVVVGEWMPISIFENEGGKFTNVTDDFGLSDSNGWWWSIASGDFDQDGDLDFVVGNLGKNTKFKATSEKPFMVYGSDFDNNGTNDIVLANYYKDKVVPVRGRECSSEQMPFIAEKYPTYEGFANASLENILPPTLLKTAAQYQVKSFKSIFLKNDSGKFTKVPLPMEAQFFPVRDIAVLDVNNDKHLDLLMVGNLYGAEVETMRYDAGIGLCMLGDGKGGFNPLKVGESGFFVPGDSRDIAVLGGKTPYILTSTNQGKIQCFDFANTTNLMSQHSPKH